MQYKKIKVENTIIEFHNNWMGEETVIVNGQIVSKKSSIWGVEHPFSVMEDGHQSRYVLTTKVGANMQVLIDLWRNGQLVEGNLPIPMGTMPKRPSNKSLKEGLKALQDYQLEEALEHFDKALDFERENPEIYFHKACAYSILEEGIKGYECLKKAIEYNLQDTEMILNHDMLAFLRIQDAFEDFVNSDFKEYDPKGIEKTSR